MPAKVRRLNVPFSQAVADVICERLTEGESLRAVCRSKGMPGLATVIRWLEANLGFRAQYARAREAQAHAIADECQAIADGARGGTNADIQAARLRVDTRKWFASKLFPKVYGDRIQAEVLGDGGGPVAVSFVDLVKKAAEKQREGAT